MMQNGKIKSNDCLKNGVAYAFVQSMQKLNLSLKERFS